MHFHILPDHQKLFFKKDIFESLVTPRLPHLAKDSVISLGSSKARKNVVVQPPAVPYFVEPGIAFGSKPVIIKEITVLPYSLRVLTF